MHDHGQAHLAGHCDGAVLAAVIHENDFVDAAGRDVGQRGRQRALGVVGRHHGDDLVVCRFGGWSPLGYEDALDVEESRARD